MDNSNIIIKKNFDYYFTYVMRIGAILMSSYHLITSYIGTLPTMQHRCLHVGFALVLIYMQSFLNAKRLFIKYSALVGVVGSFAGTYHIFNNWMNMQMRLAYPTKLDIFMGVMIIILVIDATRRKLGWALPIISTLFILYTLFGNYLPTMIGHKGYSIERLVSAMYMETSGIYGSVAGTSANYIFLFVLFGAFMEYSGASKFFIDLSAGLVGKKRGGSAKVNVVSSCLFGMVSGSAVANVMAVGPLTIPMMRDSGYTNRFAGAITAVGGTGGQLMPPIMGAAAFLIAETLTIPYMSVAKAALIPGLLYYLSIVFIINIRSEKINMKGMEVVPDWRKVLKTEFYMAAPVILLIYFLAIIRWSPIKSGFWAIMSLIAVSMVKMSTRITPKKLFNSLEKGAMGALEVAITCALAGLIVGTLTLTGLGMKFSGLLLTLSGGNLIVLLILTAIAGLILGMGMTTTSVYIVLSVTVAPALVKLGIQPLAAHLYLFYFGILSAITPPVAVASFAAASVAGDNANKLGWEAWRIGLAGYIIPVMFIFNNTLIMEGRAFLIIKAFITGCFGIFALSVSIEGFYKYKVNLVLRICLIGSALLLLNETTLTDIIGIGIMALILLPQIFRFKREKNFTNEMTIKEANKDD